MQALRCAAEVDANECERLRSALQKQEEQQVQQQQQFAQLLEALEHENRELRELKVTTMPQNSLSRLSLCLCRRRAGMRRSSPATRTCCSCSVKTNNCSRRSRRCSKSCSG